MLRCSIEFHGKGLELFWKKGNYRGVSRAKELRDAVQVSGGRLSFHCSDKVANKVH